MGSDLQESHVPTFVPGPSHERPPAPTRVAVLGAEDALRYRALMLEGYAQAPDAFTSTAQERAAEPDAFWTQRIADPAGMTVAFGAFQGGQLVGTVALEFSSKPKTAHKGLLIGMYVSPAARGQGAGRQLLAAALAFARARPGTTVITLTVTQGNDMAIKLYQAAGFAVFGAEPMAMRTPEGYKCKLHMWLRVQDADRAP